MGIRSLTGYIMKNPDEFFEPHPLHDTYLVIDGMNISVSLYSICDKQSRMMGGQYDFFCETIRNFFGALLCCDIRPIVVFDSVNSTTIDREKSIQILRRKREGVMSDPNGYYLIPGLANMVLRNILTSMKIKYVQTIGEGDETMVALAKALDCPVVSEDSDFFLQGIKFVHFSTLTPKPKCIDESSNKFALMCSLYYVTKLCRKFVSNGKILNESVLLLALPILGNKQGINYLDDEIMAPFFEKLDRDYTAEPKNYYQKKIEKTFKWLSQYSSITEAIASILTCIEIDHRQQIFDDIRMFMSEIGIASPLAIRALDLPEDITTRILDENAKKMLQIQEAMSPLKTLMELNIDGGKEDLYSTEQELVTMFPGWMIDDLLRGKLDSSPFELFMFSSVILSSWTDDENQPPTCFTSLPILEKIYSIILSLGNETEEILEIHYARGREILEMKRLVRTCSFDLRNIESCEGSERRRVINKALGIDKYNRLNELPNCWRLYVATMVFWLKQDVEPKKKKAHIFAVILAMLLGKVDDEIGVMRSMLTFQEKFGDAYKDIISKSGLMSKVVKGLSLRETMRLISKDECIAAAPFFIMHSSMTPREFDQSNRVRRRAVHTFTQFHSCLENAIVLNSILRYPYAEVPLHRTYNGLLFYTLFREFELNHDVDGWLRGQLKHSPGILESFFVLRDIVLSMLGGRSWDRF